MSCFVNCAYISSIQELLEHIVFELLVACGVMDGSTLANGLLEWQLPVSMLSAIRSNVMHDASCTSRLSNHGDSVGVAAK